jgi:hypothetical protein
LGLLLHHSKGLAQREKKTRNEIFLSSVFQHSKQSLRRVEKILMKRLSSFQLSNSFDGIMRSEPKRKRNPLVPHLLDLTTNLAFIPFNRIHCGGEML